MVASGSRVEMTERLTTILKTRAIDMVVADMLEGSDFVEQNYGVRL